MIIMFQIKQLLFQSDKLQITKMTVRKSNKLVLQNEMRGNSRDIRPSSLPNSHPLTQQCYETLHATAQPRVAS
jgi:hypothetical protein